MKKKISALILIVLLAATLTSCYVHVGRTYYERPWWYVTLIALAFIVPSLILVGIYISRHDYICSECGGRFHPKWYTAAFSIHIGSRRVFKCPHCGHRGFCDPVKREKE